MFPFWFHCCHISIRAGVLTWQNCQLVPNFPTQSVDLGRAPGAGRLLVTRSYLAWNICALLVVRRCNSFFQKSQKVRCYSYFLLRMEDLAVCAFLVVHHYFQKRLEVSSLIVCTSHKICVRHCLFPPKVPGGLLLVTPTLCKRPVCALLVPSSERARRPSCFSYLTW